MFAYIQEAGIIVWSLGLLVYFLLNFLTKKIQISVLDSLGFLNINVSFSLTTVFSLFFLNLIKYDDALNATLITLFFYMGIFIFSSINTKKIKSLFFFNRLKETVLEDGVLYKNLIIIGFLGIALTIFFSSLLFLNGSISDDRIVIAKSLRGPDLIRQGTQILLPYITLLSLTVRKNKLAAALFSLSLITSFFSGSKGFFVPYAIAYFTIYKLLNPKEKLVLKNVFFAILILVSSTFVKILWGSTPSEAFFQIIDRLFSSGDTYYYAYYLTDLSGLFKDYEFFSYILHPFTSLLLIKGYEYPIGTNLFGHVTGDYSGYGPNAYLPVLLIVLMKGNIFFASIISFLFGSAVCYARVIGLSALSRLKSFPPFWRVAIFIICFDLTPSIFIDIGLFEQAIIAVFFVVFATSAFYEISGFSYRRISPKVKALLDKE